MKHKATYGAESEMKLTEADRRLIDILQQDASLSAADLAKATNSSAATCWRKVRNLEERGILGPTVRLVDPAKVGRSIDAFCHVRMKSQDTKARQTFQRAVEVEPAILEVYSTTGEWDYLLHLVVRDIEDLNEILMRRILELDCVAGTATSFALRRIKHTTQIPT